MVELPSKAQVLRAIHERGPISRSAVAEQTGVSLSSVSLIARDYIAAGLIEETGTKKQGLGRPSIMLAVRSSAACFLGANVSDFRLVAVLSDLSGQVLGTRTRELDTADPGKIASLLARMKNDLLQQAGLPEERLVGAGFSLSGLVDAERGICLHSTVLGWRNVRIRELLEAALDLPVALENDANCVAMGEKLYGGQHVRDRDFAVMSVGQGIGCGLIVNGRLFQGHHGVTGEIGHCTAVPDGPVCRCGKRGCVEAVAGTPAILRAAADAGLEADSLGRLEELAVHEPAAADILTQAGRALGLGLSHLVNIFSPELVVVTGSGDRLGPVLRSALQDGLERNILPLLPAPPELVFQDKDETVWARGAASLAAEAFIKNGGDSADHRGTARL